MKDRGIISKFRDFYTLLKREKELTGKQLNEISRQIAEGNQLEQILADGFPKSKITLIVGHDNPNLIIFVTKAYFSETQAREAKHQLEIKDENSKYDYDINYYIHNKTVRELQGWKDREESGPMAYPLAVFDFTDLETVYELLAEQVPSINT